MLLYLVAAYYVPLFVIRSINWLFTSKVEYNIITWFAINASVMIIAGLSVIIIGSFKKE